jgi:hypothetical protein
MITHRLTRIAMAVTLAAFTYAPAAEENIHATPADDALRLNPGAPPAETTSAEPVKEPPPAADKPAETLLSDLKIYPSF